MEFLKPIYEAVFTEYGLAVIILMIGNIVQWRTNKALTASFVDVSTNTALVIERLTQRIEDIKK